MSNVILSLEDVMRVSNILTGEEFALDKMMQDADNETLFCLETVKVIADTVKVITVFKTIESIMMKHLLFEITVDLTDVRLTIKNILSKQTNPKNLALIDKIG